MRGRQGITDRREGEKRVCKGKEDTEEGEILEVKDGEEGDDEEEDGDDNDDIDEEKEDKEEEGRTIDRKKVERIKEEEICTSTEMKNS